MKKQPLIVISPTAFKGTLTPAQAAAVMAAEFRRAHPKARVVEAPLADGGDGTLETLLVAGRGRLITTGVTGPAGRQVRAEWALCPPGAFGPGRTAVIEMARASGIALLKGRLRPMEALSTGTGELLRAALTHGCRRIIMGVGGTASSDAGIGALTALGARFLDRRGRMIRGGLSAYRYLHKIDLSGLDKRLAKTTIIVLCDVINPLLGKTGSARTFSPQKGASISQVAEIEAFHKLLSDFAPIEFAAAAGSGAAGALAFGLSAFAGAKLVPGAPAIMKLTGWEKTAKGAALIVTGEGRLDATSFGGKTVGEIVRRRGRAAVWAVCGSTPFGSAALRRRGISCAAQLGPRGLLDPKFFLQRTTRDLSAKETSGKFKWTEK